MIDTVKTVKPATSNRTPLAAATPKLIAGAMFGLVFGFLLQKGALENTTCSSANCFFRTGPS
jgi:hypothetical protein